MGRLKPIEAEFSEEIHIRISKRQKELLESKAIELRVDKSQLVRTAISDYINKNLNDTELLYASVNDNTVAMRRLHDQFELIYTFIIESTRHIIKVLPMNTVNTDSMADEEIEKIIRSTKEELLKHPKRLTQIVLDLYQNGVE